MSEYEEIKHLELFNEIEKDYNVTDIVEIEKRLAIKEFNTFEMIKNILMEKCFDILSLVEKNNLKLEKSQQMKLKFRLTKCVNENDLGYGDKKSELNLNIENIKKKFKLSKDKCKEKNNSNEIMSCFKDCINENMTNVKSALNDFENYIDILQDTFNKT